jgi:hypothetical protein
VFSFKIQHLIVSRQDAKTPRKPSRFDPSQNSLRLCVFAGKLLNKSQNSNKLFKKINELI